MRAIAAVVVVAVVAVIAYLGWLFTERDAGDEPVIAEMTAAPADTPDTTGATDPTVATGTTDTADFDTTATIAEGAVTTAEPDAVAAGDAPIPPSFDIVRISPEGNAVIAGRAEPGAEVVVTEGGTVIAEVTADARGEWVAVPEAPIEPGTRELALTERTVEGERVESDSVVVIAVPDRETTADTAADRGALAVLVPRAETGGSQVLQAPEAGVGLRGSEAMSLDTIEYDETGAIVLGGRASPGSRIAVYSDNRFIGSAVTGDDRVWRVTPDEAVQPGLHNLRIDEVDAAGAVVARVETPFARADFTLPEGAGALVIVQPGNSLWRIARRTYGRGPQYVTIFEANLDQIRDPDLIYPGQVFVLPTAN